jgi:ankyrin repeat protein
MKAAWQGHQGAAKVLLASGASLTLATPSGWSPLHSAAHGDATGELVRCFLSAGANPLASAPQGWLPAFEAAQMGNVAALVLLLDAAAEAAGAAAAAAAGAAAAAAEPLGGGPQQHVALPPLHPDDWRTATGSKLIHVAAESGQESAVRALLARGTDVDARKDIAGVGGGGGAGGGSNPTALYMAAERGHLGVVRALLAYGATPTLLVHADTAYKAAFRRGHFDVAMELLFA